MCKALVTTWRGVGRRGGLWCLFLLIHLMTWKHSTVFVSIHLMTCTFDNLSIHLMTYTFDSVCVDPSHDSTVTYYYWLCLSRHLTTCRHIWQMCSSHDLEMLLTVFVSFHLMTCRHFWQCLCPSISWPQTLLTMFVSIYLMTCRHIWQCVCPSHDLHTFDSLSSSISWPADTFDSICVHPSYIIYWSLLYSAILRSRADLLRSHVILHEWIAFYSAFLNIH